MEEHLRQRGYVPSRHARHLRAAPERVIGILYVNDLFIHLMDAMNRLTSELGARNLGVELMRSRLDHAEAAVRELLARRVTDLIWIHNSRSGAEYRNPAIASYLTNIRTIVYNHDSRDQQADEALLSAGMSLIDVNRVAQMHRFGSVLHRLGHRRIALPDDERAGQHYVEAFQRAGLTVVPCGQDIVARDWIRLMKKECLTAIHFHGDSRASLFLAALRQEGVRIPDDLTITGFDGTSTMYGKDLTILALPTAEMVQRVCDILDGEQPEGRHELELHLLKGGSHAKPRAC